MHVYLKKHFFDQVIVPTTNLAVVTGVAGFEECQALLMLDFVRGEASACSYGSLTGLA